jgi:hypothetical protein
MSLIRDPGVEKSVAGRFRCYSIFNAEQGSGTTGGLLYTTGAGDSRGFNLHNLKFYGRLIKGQYKSGIEVL